MQLTGGGVDGDVYERVESWARNQQKNEKDQALDFVLGDINDVESDLIQNENCR